MIKQFVYVSILVLLFGSNLICNAEPDYYWREYVGVIPDDAIPAGRNLKGENIYIGQGYLHEYGIITGQITPGIKEISVVDYGIHVIDRYIKILCGQKEKFGWIRTSNDTFHEDVAGQVLVIGGYDSDPNGLGGDINVGRIVYRGETHVGKVDAWNNNGADFRIKVINYYDNTFETVSIYEILVYNG